jgi:AhpD family alkylhydroperoxidase
MASAGLDDFARERERLQQLMLEYAGRDMKRFLALDHQAYEEGVLSRGTKELLGLVASLALRCDDCVSYHLLRCRDEGVGTPELIEALTIALIVGGSITIPHLRRALADWDRLAKG